MVALAAQSLGSSKPRSHYMVGIEGCSARTQKSLQQRFVNVSRELIKYASVQEEETEEDMIDEAIKALEIAIKEIKLSPKELEGLQP